MDPISDAKAVSSVALNPPALTSVNAPHVGGPGQPSFSAVVAGSGDAQLPAKAKQAIQEFTAVITSQFIGEILKEQEGMFSSGGSDSQFYHSMLVNAVSEKLAETDAFGIGAVLETDIEQR